MLQYVSLAEDLIPLQNVVIVLVVKAVIEDPTASNIMLAQAPAFASRTPKERSRSVIHR
jgi:uncharacterized membrane protein